MVESLRALRPLGQTSFNDPTKPGTRCSFGKVQPDPCFVSRVYRLCTLVTYHAKQVARGVGIPGAFLITHALMAPSSCGRAAPAHKVT